MYPGKSEKTKEKEENKMKKYRRWMFKVEKWGVGYSIFFKGNPVSHGHLTKKAAKARIKEYIKEANAYYGGK